MAIVFHTAPQSSATRVHWALEELGVPYEKVVHQLRTPEMRDPAFLKVNPNGRVPALELDGVPMWESLAIILHLGDRFGVAKGLWPRADDPQRAAAITWATWGPVHVGTMSFRYFMNTSERFPAEARNAAQAANAKREVDDSLRILEERLDGRDFVLGSAFSLADITCASALTILARSGYPMDAYPRVKDWLGRLMARPAFKTAAAG